MNRSFTQRLRRGIYGGLGWCAVTLGLAGVVIPGLPATEFLLAAAYFFSRSSPRFEAWLQANRWLGPRLRRFRESGGMPVRAKVAALLSMWIGIAISSVALASIHNLVPLVTFAAGVVGSFAILFFVRTVPEAA
jgi:uncharacterized protein